MSAVVTRFAPSPTGALHLGHAYAAWFAWRRARAAGGTFLLRLEDIDAGRCRPEHAGAILDDLLWLGLHWDGEVLVQSQRWHLYGAALAALRARGLIYPCFCSRSDILREIADAATAPHAPDGVVLYPGTCKAMAPPERARRLAQALPHAWRLDMAAASQGLGALSFAEDGEGRVACDPAAFGDVVLGRRDHPGSYHLCVTHDDASQGVSLVTRGRDLRPATALHRLLQHLMGWPEPAYAHHALVTDAAGRRLAKRDHAVTIAALRNQGLGPAEVLRHAGCVPA